MRTIYLDNAATTPVDPRVLDAMRPFLEQEFGNPSSRHRMGVRALEALDDARRHIARVTGADKERIWFTAGGTEANNLAILGIARATRSNDGETGKHILIGPTEHAAVRDAALALEDEGFEIEVMRLDEHGALDLVDAEQRLREDTILVSQMVASNEFGSIYPIRELARLVRAKSPRAVLHCDAVQALGKVDVDLEELGCDSIAISSHKVHAPKGTGALIFARDIPIRPLFFGGGQEGKVRPGTQNPSGIVGFGEAVRICDEEFESANRHMHEMRDLFAKGIAEIEGTRVLEPGAPAYEFLPSVLSVLFPGVPSEVRLHHLDARGVLASAGAACSAGSKDLNPALLALGLNDDEARSVLRFSFARTTTREEVEEALRIVHEVSRELEALKP